MKTLSLPVVPAAMGIDPIKLVMPAQILSILDLFIVQVLAMARAALATTTPKGKDLGSTASQHRDHNPIVDQEVGVLWPRVLVRPVQRDLRIMGMKVQSGGQRRTAAATSHTLIPQP